MKRFRPKEPIKVVENDYFDRENIEFIPTGCTMLDCLVGGGWAGGRVINIVGDRAVGKTLLGIEAAANFAKKYPKGKIRIRESEGAFDVPYAETVGLPVDRVDFGRQGPLTEWNTFDDVFEDVRESMARDLKDKSPAGLYIIDSLDALTTRAALERKVGEDTYGLEKQRMLGLMLSQEVRNFKATNTCVIFISQTRQNIGAMFGNKYRRVCGQVLNFYSSQIVWLSNLGHIHQTVRGIKLDIGVDVKVRSEKNKVGASTGDCEFSIRFKYGIDDLWVNLLFLLDAKALKPLGLPQDKKALADYADETDAMLVEARKQRFLEVRNLVVSTWEEIQNTVVPKNRKYE